MSKWMLCSPPFFVPSFADPYFVRLNGALRNTGQEITTYDLNLSFFDVLTLPDVFKAISPVVEEKVKILQKIPEYERSKLHRRDFLNLINSRSMSVVLQDSIESLKNQWTSDSFFEPANLVEAYLRLRYVVEAAAPLYTPIPLSLIQFPVNTELNRLSWDQLKEWSESSQAIIDQVFLPMIYELYDMDSEKTIITLTHFSQLPFTCRLLQLLQENHPEKEVIVTGNWVSRRLEDIKKQDWLQAMAKWLSFEEVCQHLDLELELTPDYQDIEGSSYWLPHNIHPVLTQTSDVYGGFRELGISTSEVSIDKLIQEVQTFEKFNYFYFTGAPLTGEQLQQLATQLNETLETPIFWMADATLDTSWASLDIKSLFDSGCRQLTLNDLPLNPFRESYQNNSCTLDDSVSYLLQCREHGIWTHTDLQIGLPGESQSEHENLLENLNKVKGVAGSIHPYPFYLQKNGRLTQKEGEKIKCLNFPGQIQDMPSFVHVNEGVDDYLRVDMSHQCEQEIRQWPGSPFLWMLRLPPLYSFLVVCEHGRTIFEQLQTAKPNHEDFFKAHTEIMNIRQMFLPQVGLNVIEKLAYTM